MTDATDDFDVLFDQISAERLDKLAIMIVAPTLPPVALEGELTIYQVAQVKVFLQQAFAAANAERAPLRLNMSAVTECDGAGLQLLLALALAAYATDAPIELLETPTKIAAIFHSYGVAGHFAPATRGAAP